MYHSTYFAYGLRIPIEGPAWEETDRLDKELPHHKESCPDVGHLSAGNYDCDMLFLVTSCDEIKLGDYGRQAAASADKQADWDRQLTNAVEQLGYGHLRDLVAPGWLCVPDLS
ncbi:hypothetical protein [Streptomyces murinus]